MNKPLLFTAVGVTLAFSGWLFYPAQHQAPEQVGSEQLLTTEQSVTSIADDEDSNEVNAQPQIDLPATVNRVPQKPTRQVSQQTFESEPAPETMDAESERPPGLDQNEEVVTPNPAFAQHEQQFWDEKPDEAWAASSSEHIADFFEQQGSQTEETFGSKLSNVECRSSLCRVEVVHNDLRAEQNFGMKFANDLADQDIKSITFQAEKTPDGRIVQVMFVSK